MNEFDNQPVEETAEEAEKIEAEEAAEVTEEFEVNPAESTTDDDNAEAETATEDFAENTDENSAEDVSEEVFYQSIQKQIEEKQQGNRLFLKVLALLLALVLFFAGGGLTGYLLWGRRPVSNNVANSTAAT
ncbi:MAG: hypothetical protein MJ132_08070, partial [Clostridia bacterium]|nr:hypothetical protein [Clostridia bacterium]